MRPNDIRLFQGYIGNLTVSHNSIVTVVMIITNAFRKIRIYLLLPHTLSEAALPMTLFR